MLAIAKIYGTQFGLPHPGLMPTKAEVDLRRGWIADAIAALERKGVDADGQLAATRKPIKLIARVAVARSVEHVVVDEGTADRRAPDDRGRHGQGRAPPPARRRRGRS